jgi:Zn-dependent protease
MNSSPDPVRRPAPAWTFKLFTAAGIDVFLHFSWFLVAYWQISRRLGTYESPLWAVFEYLALFAIVLVHEFGHALACRQVGGQAHRIVLWPLGGIAYVSPPRRPGATLWSIAAGPLVNVALVPVFLILGVAFPDSAGMHPDAHALLTQVTLINYVLLIFNLLPIFPLDGGQILWSMLWYVFGEGRSLMITVVVGFLGVGAGLVYAFLRQETWLMVLGAFALLRCINGFQYARALLRSERNSGANLS